MVKRKTPSSGSSRAGATKHRERGSRSKGDDDDMYQQPGKLMLNNPLIPADLDEDIDDDLAFNSDDERMYGHLFQKSEEAKPSKSKATKKASKKGRKTGDDDEAYYDDALEAVGKAHRGSKRGAVDDDEALYNYHEDGQTSDDDDDYIDLSDMLDQSLADEKKKRETTSTSQKKKASMVEAEDGQHVTKKRRAAKLNDDEENLFGTAAVSDVPSSKSFGSTLRKLVDSGEAQSTEEEKARTRLQQAMSGKHNLLSTDMDDIAKTRLTRREVREVVKGDMKKYAPLLREMTASKHMQFPMQLPDSNPTPSTIGGIVAASRQRFGSANAGPDGEGGATRALQTPGTAGSLAGRMNALLATAGLSAQRGGSAAGQASATGDDGIGAFVRFDDKDGEHQAYTPQDGSVDGERPTTNYMAKLKAMLSYENSRRKRLNRIKSKTYRRIVRKEQDREKERRQAAFELLHPELARKRLAERLAKARAEERVTQKHKNTSVWVKRAKRFANIDENAKDAVNEQLAVHQRLMSKMEQEAGEDMHNLYDADADATDSEEEERLVDELFSQMHHERDGGAPVDVEALTRKIWGLDKIAEAENGAARTPTARARAELRAMKFMKAARERTEKGLQDRTESLLDSVRRARAGEDVSAEDEDDNEENRGEAPSEGSAALRSRKRFVTKAAARSGAVEAVQLKSRAGPRADDDVDDADFASRTAMFTNEADDDNAGGDHARALAGFAGDRQGRRGQPSTSTRVTVRYEAHKRPRDQQDDDDGEADRPDSVAGDGSSDHDDGHESEEDLQAQQQYLIARAFAHDDVDEDFLKEKEAQVDMIMKPEDKNQNLPGWGEWGGEDPTLNRKHQEKLAHTAAQKRIERTFLVKSRADAALEHVIINHDGVELVPDRMTLHMIPRPFSNPTEFARSMRQPLGPEWSSALSFKERAQPRVEVRQGQSVMPLDLSLRKKTTKTKRRKTEKSKSS